MAIFNASLNCSIQFIFVIISMLPSTVHHSGQSPKAKGLYGDQFLRCQGCVELIYVNCLRTFREHVISYLTQHIRVILGRIKQSRSFLLLIATSCCEVRL